MILHPMRTKKDLLVTAYPHVHMHEYAYCNYPLGATTKWRLEGLSTQGGGSSCFNFIAPCFAVAVYIKCTVVYLVKFPPTLGS
jgi:hypothetical protein